MITHIKSFVATNNVDVGEEEAVKKRYYLYLDKKEIDILLQSLIGLKNSLIREGRYADCVDDIIIRIIKAKLR